MHRLCLILSAAGLLASCNASVPKEISVPLTEGREAFEAAGLGHNPISPMGVYMADPSARVMDGRLYVACSLDLNSQFWCSPYHHMLSTGDLLHF